MEEIDYLKKFEKTSIKPTLQRINLLLNYLGNPQKDLRCIHIAGTNGKGSTAEMISAMYQEAGYNTGTFVSPGVIDLNERIRINNEKITDKELSELVNQIKPFIKKVDDKLNYPSFFEIITSLAFMYFSNKKTDLVVLETGIGGRLDATNVVDSIISVITNVGLDHTDYLGNTIEEIAREKAGIIKRGQKVITASQNDKVLEIIKEKVRQNNSHLININNKYEWNKINFNYNYQTFNLRTPTRTLNNLEVSLLGRFQILNAVTALAVIEALNYKFYVSAKNIRKALKNIVWPGRLEVFNKKTPIILDGSHNLTGIKSLNKEISRFEYNNLIMIVSIFEDKDIKKMIGELDKKADLFVLTQNNAKRSAKPLLLKNNLPNNTKSIIKSDLNSSLNYSLNISNDDDMIIITGSLHNVTEIRNILLAMKD